MKNKFQKTLLAFAFLLVANFMMAQAPQGIPYQAVARDNAGNLIKNQNIALRFSIHDGTASGAVVYSENHSVTTDALGLFSVNIGGGTSASTLANVNWGSGAKFTQVELDVTGGSNYVDMGTTQMLSVPYALYAGTANVPGVAGPQGTTGPQGPSGATGATGLTGPQGPAGATGEQGTAGATGATGPAPSGTGIVTVSGGTLQTPAALSGDVSTSGAALSTTLSTSAATGGRIVTAINASSSTINAANLASTVTTQGNTFNGNSQLVQTTANGKLPALDGSNLTNLPSSGGGGAGAIQCYAGISANAALATGAQDAPFNTTSVNVGSQFASGAFTASAAGYYLVTFQLYSTYAAVTANNPFLKLNGVTTYYGSTATNTNMQTTTQCVFSQIIKLSAGDVIKPGVWTSTANATLQSGNSTYFAVYKL